MIFLVNKVNFENLTPLQFCPQLFCAVRLPNRQFPLWAKRCAPNRKWLFATRASHVSLDAKLGRG